jgi:hypothetical protein
LTQTITSPDEIRKEIERLLDDFRQATTNSEIDRIGRLLEARVDELREAEKPQSGDLALEF